MAYKNKTYVAFDADNDIHYYLLMKAWKQSDNTDFNFHDAHDLNTLWKKSNEETIKRKLLERMKNTNVFVLLVGDKTKNLYKYVRWEIQEAQKREIPIIAVNLNGDRMSDSERLPPLVRDDLSISISFKARMLQYALENWPSSFAQRKRNDEKGRFHYKDSVYSDLGL